MYTLLEILIFIIIIIIAFFLISGISYIICKSSIDCMLDVKEEDGELIYKVAKICSLPYKFMKGCGMFLLAVFSKQEK